MKPIVEIIIEEINDYRGSHTAPGPNGDDSPMYDVTTQFGEDIYGSNAVKMFGGYGPYDRYSVDLIQRARNKPNMQVRIYRAVPKVITNQEKIDDYQRRMKYILKTGKLPRDVDNFSNSSEYYDWLSIEIEKLKTLPTDEKTKINSGDWVTINPAYAKIHGYGNLNNKFKVLSKTVSAKNLFTDGNSIHEWGYNTGTSTIINEQTNSKKLYYHGRKMGGRPYSSKYIFITDDLGYASGYSDGKTLYTYTMPFGEDKLFSIKNPTHRNLLSKYVDQDSILHMRADSGPDNELDWATLSYIGTDEFEDAVDLFEHMGFLGVYLKERTGIESIYIFNEKYLKFEGEIDITTPEMIKQIGKFYKDFTKGKNFLEEAQNLDEDLNKISLQTAVDKKMFGPVYHGTTTENRENIEREGFKIFMGADRGENIRHGYPGERTYAQGTPPPIHHLGYGIYFTTVKTIAKAFNVDSAKGLKTYYLDVPKLETINFASPNRMMEWWIKNGYDAEFAKQGQQGRIDATKKMTENLMKRFDAVWFKGKTMYRVLDGDQIVVFDTNNIYQIDPGLAGELEIGSKVRRASDKFDYRYTYSTDSSEPKKELRTVPTVVKGTIGVIKDKKPTKDIIQRWMAQIPPPDDDVISNVWFKDSQNVYSVKWNKGGTENNVLDKDIEPLNKQKMVAEIVREEIQDFNRSKNFLEKPRIIQVIDDFELASREADENAFGAEEGQDSWRGTFSNAMSPDAQIRYQEYMKNQSNLEVKRLKAKELQDKAQALADEIRKEYNWYRKSVRGKGMKQYANLSDMIKFFREKYSQTTNEGIADRYAEKAFNIPNPNIQQDIQAKGEMQKEIEKPFAYVNDVAVYKNPKSLKYIGKNVRAIGTISGNLYVSEKDGGFMHGQMGRSIGLEKDDMSVYSGKYLLLYRNGFIDEFTLSDTGLDDYPKYKEYFDEVIKNIKVKNPRYNINTHDWSSEDIIQEEIQNLMNNLRFKNYPQEEYVEDVANNLQKEQRSKNDILANVDIQLADEAFRRDEDYYIGKGDLGIGGRREKLRNEILYGDLKYAPIATIIMRNGQPVLSFTDGRHRFAELRDLGAKSINIAFSRESQKYIPLLQK